MVYYLVSSIAINAELCNPSDIRLSHKEIAKNDPVIYAVNTDAKLELKLPSILNEHCIKYARARVFWDPMLSHIRAESEFVLIQVNTITKRRTPVYFPQWDLIFYMITATYFFRKSEII